MNDHLKRPTRREFFATTSGALAGAALGVRAVHAQPLPANLFRTSASASTFLPEPMPELDLRALATTAVDAARNAGASYADIRLAEQTMLRVVRVGNLDPNTDIGVRFTYGLRVRVDGAWAFAYGTRPTSDAIAASARDAVATARGYARLMKPHDELVPAAVVTGTWDTPITLDPFTVPLRDQGALLDAYLNAANRVRHGSMEFPGFHWSRETRVFSSSEGTLTVQTLRRSEPEIRTSGGIGMGKVFLRISGLYGKLGGYETVTAAGLQDEIKRTTEDAVRIASLPRREADVGRYPVVFDGITLGAALGRTIGVGLELDRVLGDEADASGSSYLSPPNDMLGTEIVSPLLTVTANRAMPAVSAVKWDDEGVEPQAYSLITQGRLVDYHTSRQTAPALQAWYARNDRPLRSNGCAVAFDAEDPVLVRTPHLTVTPETKTANIEDLYKDLPRGILVRNASYMATDQQLSSCNLFHGVMLEIERGKIVRRVDGNGLQFGTSKFWKSLIALGDSSTVQSIVIKPMKGQPWVEAAQSTSAPAALFKDVNVISRKVHV
jgi:TldD protein